MNAKTAVSGIRLPAFFARRPALCASISLALGILAGRGLPYDPRLWAALVPAGAAAAVLKARQRRRAAACLALLMLFLCGLQLASGRMQGAAELPAGDRTLQGVIAGEVRHSAKGIWFDLRDVSVREEDGTWTDLDCRVYCFVMEGTGEGLRCGQPVRVRGTVSEPQVPDNPGSFDQREWLAGRNVKAALFTRGEPEVLGEAAFTLTGLALALREGAARHADLLFGEESQAVRAMLLGDTKSLTEQWRGWFASGGISHLLAVSGLHVGFWYGLMVLALRRFHLRPGVRWLCLAGMLAVYAFVTGLRDSVIRASLMLLFATGGLPTGRRNDPLNSMGAAALFILLARPLDLFTAGFQLSFGAVFGILLFAPQLRRLPHGKILGGLGLTVCAQAGSMPVLASVYGRLPLLGFVINIAAVPVAGVLVPFAALAMALSAPLLPLGQAAAVPVRILCRLLAEMGRLADAVPGQILMLPRFSWPAMLCWWGGMIVFSSAVTWKLRRRLLTVVTAAAVVFGVCFVTADRRDRYVQLAVGEALSGVFEVENTCVVFDCGKENGDLAEYLAWRNAHVDALFISHPHADHYGGLGEVLDDGIAVGRIYVPVNAEAYEEDPVYRELLRRAQEAGIPVTELSAGDTVTEGDLRFEVLAPGTEAPAEGETNDRSLALRTVIRGTVLLLCGDADGPTEPAADCDILQVAHHGSAASADADVLASMTPRTALISSSGARGHPSKKMLERLAEAGCEVWVTRDSGAITVFFNDGGYEVEGYLP